VSLIPRNVNYTIKNYFENELPNHVDIFKLHTMLIAFDRKMVDASFLVTLFFMRQICCHCSPKGTCIGAAGSGATFYVALYECSF
jgi:hypothetical protein